MIDTFAGSNFLLAVNLKISYYSKEKAFRCALPSCLSAESMELI